MLEALADKVIQQGLQPHGAAKDSGCGRPHSAKLAATSPKRQAAQVEIQGHMDVEEAAAELELSPDWAFEKSGMLETCPAALLPGLKKLIAEYSKGEDAAEGCSTATGSPRSWLSRSSMPSGASWHRPQSAARPWSAQSGSGKSPSRDKTQDTPSDRPGAGYGSMCSASPFSQPGQKRRPASAGGRIRSATYTPLADRRPLTPLQAALPAQENVFEAAARNTTSKPLLRSASDVLPSAPARHMTNAREVQAVSAVSAPAQLQLSASMEQRKAQLATLRAYERAMERFEHLKKAASTPRRLSRNRPRSAGSLGRTTVPMHS